MMTDFEDYPDYNFDPDVAYRQYRQTWTGTMRDVATVLRNSLRLPRG